MVSDSELVGRIREIIRGSDLNTTTAGGVRRRLEEVFSIDLHERRHFIREQIDIFLHELRECQNNEPEAEQEEENENGNDENSEEEEKMEKSDEDRSSKDRSNQMDKDVKKKGRGFTKPCTLSPQLQELFGVSELARTEVVKKIWAYIREKNLQNPKDRRKILCDERLHGIFRVRSIDMFKMNKALSKHIWPMDEAQEPEEEQGEETANENGGDQEDEISQEEEEEEEETGEDSGSNNKRSNKMDKDVKKRGGFTKPCALSPQLQELLGVPELARTEVVKKLWVYIREKNLQNPKNKRKILCDEALHGIFRVRSIDMFQMNKALSKHIWPLDEAEAKSSKKERQREAREEELDRPKRKEKPRKGGGSGLTAPLPLSDALVNFFGTGESELSRADVVKKMWQYIKENELQDPSDKRTVLCDEKLKELFKVDSFHGFGVSKLLTVHFIKTQR
ncbi:eukaryotic translation initiation factor 5B [Olea europaea subsp. europaea]|uniref:Eukaryotic translation initiation factor 5B n=1 Tax=Olea europaea subsp. europaea TaxID=158383 RepID=A0A8S0T7J3_OLEEU|nr:eukaryotic translation initiation factor 5B [Olea europaea subsp. europaea]